MTNKFMGRSQINECPHKTVSRFYDSLEAKLWRCDWCGAEFRLAESEFASKTVEIQEPKNNWLPTAPAEMVAAEAPKAVNDVYGRAPNPSLAKKFRTERREAANYPRPMDTSKENS